MWAQLAGLLALLCLRAQADVPVQADFQQEQFTGRWYSIGLASNTLWFKENKASLKMCTTVITPMEDGSLEVASTFAKQNKCETKRKVFGQTEQPGHFRYTNSRSTDDIRVMETNYSEYALLCVQMARGGQMFTMVTLYGRSQQLRPELLQRFTQAALRLGIAQEDILLLPRTDLCMAEAADMSPQDQAALA